MIRSALIKRMIPDFPSLTQGTNNDTARDLFVLVYNALPSHRSAVISIPVPQSSDYDISKVVNGEVDKQNVEQIPSLVVAPMKAGEPERHVVHFDTGPIDPLGASIFRVKQTTAASGENVALNLDTIVDSSTGTFHLSNEFMTVHFNR